MALLEVSEKVLFVLEQEPIQWQGSVQLVQE